MDLIKRELSGLPEQYQTMLDRIQSNFPAIAKATKNFNKSQSQFMDNMLTVTQPTELRSARQILAEINKAKMALDEAYFSIRKKQVQIKRKREEADELADIEAEELESQIRSSMGYVEGAIRKISAFMTQYQNILKKYGKEEFTEADFEADEERYHIMKAFEQALCAARSHGGVVDEGNHIYFFQIGISGTAAQVEVRNFLTVEGKIVEAGAMPPHDMTVKWLHTMAEKYAGCATEYARRKGMSLVDGQALLGVGL